MYFRTTSLSPTGTSFHNIVVYASYEQLSEIFGNIHREPGDKVNVCWVLRSDDGKIVTLYDYKEYEDPRLIPDRKHYWHVGAKGYYGDAKAKELCEQLRQFIMIKLYGELE